MRVISCSATNFASYPQLEFNLGNLGLCLISGPTGAGKSTLMDVVAWGLFGQTAKDGNADEIRSWQTTAPTTVCISVETNRGSIYVFRTRGASKENDLYWTENFSGDCHRGKDLNETQKLLNDRLGMDFDQYTTGAYLHEFSPTASFFVANAKTRRAIFEKVADLSLPVKLSARCSEEKKKSTSEIDKLEYKIVGFQARLTATTESWERNKRQLKDWDERQSSRVEDLRSKAVTFEEDKKVKVSEAKRRYRNWEADSLAKMEALETKLQEAERELAFPQASECRSCGQSVPLEAAKGHAEKEYAKIRKELLVLADLENPYASALDAAKKEVNQYSEISEVASKEVNPFFGLDNDLWDQLANVRASLEQVESSQAIVVARYNSLNRLQELSYDLRAALLQKAVQEIQDNTNSYLTRFFDSEIAVTFELEGADSLTVGIQKSGYDCVYKQLSKGQRGLLRLCFSVAMMEASSNSAGTHFSALMFDEALDGLDTSMKLKAFRVFEELATKHETVLVVDHCEELKELFQTRFEVSMEADASRIERLE